MLDRVFPTEFEDLERFAPSWALPSVDARLATRCQSSMDEIREFYDTAIARAPQMIAYLEQFDLHDIPEDAGRLMQLLLGLAQASVAIEIQGQPMPTNCRFPIGVSLTSGVSPFG